MFEKIREELTNIYKENKYIDYSVFPKNKLLFGLADLEDKKYKTSN